MGRLARRKDLALGTADDRDPSGRRIDQLTGPVIDVDLTRARGGSQDILAICVGTPTCVHCREQIRLEALEWLRDLASQDSPVLESSWADLGRSR